MSRFTLVRGYAIAFGQTIWFGDRFERIERGAFNAMLAGPVADVALCWESHERSSPVLAQPPMLGLFADGYGLGFYALLDMGGRCNQNWGRLRAMMRARNPVDQVSVGGFTIREMRTDTYQGQPRNCITRATIDHIAIVDQAAYGQYTGVWVPDRLPDAPASHRVHDLAERWAAGRAAAIASRNRPARSTDNSSSRPFSAEIRVAAASMHAASRARMTDSARLRAFLSDRMHSYAEIRQAADRGLFGTQVIMHAAFSRAGGFRG